MGSTPATPKMEILIGRQGVVSKACGAVRLVVDTVIGSVYSDQSTVVNQPIS